MNLVNILDFSTNCISTPDILYWEFSTSFNNSFNCDLYIDNSKHTKICDVHDFVDATAFSLPQLV